MGFGIVAIAYIVALLLTISLIFFVIYHIIAFDELKTDYKNPVDQCRNLNPLVLPEYCIHAIITLFFLVTWQLMALVLNVPLLAYHVHRFITRPVRSGYGLYHPTSILNSNELNRAMKEGWVKLAFYILTFFYYLYGMIASLIAA
uniref:Protein cornichon n=1 Tax=Mesocestoides corti TaxID=53468 RepID=A0A5K3EN89_MESCO